MVSGRLITAVSITYGFLANFRPDKHISIVEEASCRKSYKYLIIHFSYKDSVSTPQRCEEKRAQERLPWMGLPRRQRVAQEAGRRYPAPQALWPQRSPGRRPEEVQAPGPSPLGRCAALEVLRAPRRGPGPWVWRPGPSHRQALGAGSAGAGRGFPPPEPQAPRPRAQPGPAARARKTPGAGRVGTPRTHRDCICSFSFIWELDLFIFYLQRSKNNIHITRQPWEDPKIVQTRGKFTFNNPV